MAIEGAHSVFLTPEGEALRAMLRDVFGFQLDEPRHPTAI